MNKFVKKYIEFEDSKILEIIYNSQDYQPAAVAAAQIIASERNLTVEYKSKNENEDNDENEIKAQQLNENKKKFDEIILKSEENNFEIIKKEIDSKIAIIKIKKNDLTSSIVFDNPIYISVKRPLHYVLIIFFDIIPVLDYFKSSF